MEKWKKEYENIKVPEEMRERIERAVKRAQKEKKRMRRMKMWKKVVICHCSLVAEEILKILKGKRGKKLLVNIRNFYYCL